jgi:hypothetical protein
MNKNKTVRAFRRRLLLEGLLKALSVALCLALGAGLLFTLVCHLLLIKTALLPFFLTMAGVLLFSFPFVFFIGHFPTLKKTARRMDEMGLKDRTVTMLENENNQSVMARLQREDAKKQIGSLRARKMKLRLSGKVLAALLCPENLSQDLPNGVNAAKSALSLVVPCRKILFHVVNNLICDYSCLR